jgi:predicted MPP superfamily phosphohydrolase
MRFLPLVVAVVIVFGGAGIFVGMRTVEPLNLPRYTRLLGWVLVLWPATLPLWVSLDRMRAGLFSELGSGGAYITLGLLSLLFTFTFLRDLTWVALKLANRLLAIPRDLPEVHGFLWTTGLVIFGCSILFAGVGLRNALIFPAVKRVELGFKNLHTDLQNYTIVQLSDLHLGLFRGARFLKEVVEKVNSMHPDLVVITGDLSDGSEARLGKESLPLKSLDSTALFVMGNHDFYWSPSEWEKRLAALGVDVLKDAHRIISVGGAKLMVVGVSDPTTRAMFPEHPSGLAAAMPNPGVADLTVLLAHRPGTGYEAAERGIDLQLSGHTHGGQFFPWTHVIRFIQPFAVGLHRHKGTWIYCSRGTGFWGPPMRLGAPAEITLIQLMEEPR